MLSGAMDASDNDEVAELSRSSNKELTKKNDFNEKPSKERTKNTSPEECSGDETRQRRLCNALSRSCNSFGSLKIIKKRGNSGLRSLFSQDRKLNDIKVGFNCHRKMFNSSNDPIDEGHLCFDSNEDTDFNTEKDIDSFGTEDFLHLENSIRISRLMNERKVTSYAEGLLYDSIQYDDVNEICDLLRKHKELSLEEPNNFGITPLHRAAIDGSYRCLNFLLSRNVNVKVRDRFGWTPLHDAVYHGHIRCAAALITAGSDVEAETNDFIKPIEIALDDEMLLLVGRAMSSPGYVNDQDRETLV